MRQLKQNFMVCVAAIAFIGLSLYYMFCIELWIGLLACVYIIVASVHCRLTKSCQPSRILIVYIEVYFSILILITCTYYEEELLNIGNFFKGIFASIFK